MTESRPTPTHPEGAAAARPADRRKLLCRHKIDRTANTWGGDMPRKPGRKGTGLRNPCRDCGKGRDETEFYAGRVVRCKECHKAYMRARQATDEFRERNREAQREWRYRNTEKYTAQCLLHEAVKGGAVVRPDACEQCGESESLIDAHHDDYSKPYDVTWLCRQCHKDEHKNA